LEKATAKCLIPLYYLKHYNGFFLILKEFQIRPSNREPNQAEAYRVFIKEYYIICSHIAHTILYHWLEKIYR
jgi:hypothetical protein